MSDVGHSQKANQYGPYEFKLGDELRGERATLGKSLLDIQRDLRIKAAYIAAIENCDPSVFPNPSFIAGYIRSYARYLKLDPDEVFWRFCQESGFSGAHGATGEAGEPRAEGAYRGREAAAKAASLHFPLAEPRRRGMPDVPLAALGSLVVLITLIGGLGYGGWALLQNIQRVQFAPVDEVPVALAEVPTLAPPEAGAGPVLPELATPVAATALVDLYRQQELEVPILVPRDGPIAAIDPDKIGLLARARPETAAVASLGNQRTGTIPEDAAEIFADGDAAPDEPQVTTTPERPVLTVIAERPAWIRVYFGNGTVIFERILESGETYEVPETAEAPLIWAGNSGSVYVRINEVLHGPIGSGTRAVRDVPLEADTIGGRFGVVEDVPGVISEALGNLVQPSQTLVQ